MLSSVRRSVGLGLLLSALALGCGGGTSATGASPNPGPSPSAGPPVQPDVDVSIELRDAGSDGVSSDGQGPYVGDAFIIGESPFDDGESILVFTLPGFGGPANPTDRALILDLTRGAEDELGSRAVPQPGALGLPFERGAVATSLTVTPRDEMGGRLEGGFFGLREGETRLATMKINFHHLVPGGENARLYTVRFRPESPESTLVRVTFRGGAAPCKSGAECAVWEIEAVAGPVECDCTLGATTDIGTLLREDTWDEGDFHLPFRMTVTAMP